MLILCFLNLFSVLIFFFLHSLHRFCSYSFLSFLFLFFFTVLSLLSFYFSVSQFFFPLLFFFLSVISCCCLYFRCQLYTNKKKKKERKKYSHLQKSSFQIHIMMSTGERSGVFIPTKPRPADTVFILFYSKTFLFPFFPSARHHSRRPNPSQSETPR